MNALHASPDREDRASSTDSISVVITAYSDERWETAVNSVESALRQSSPAAEVILAIDNNPALAERARTTFGNVLIVRNTGPRGASGARNAGALHSRGNIVAFLDDDQVAEPNWLASLCRHFDDPDVIGVGGGIALSWPHVRPGWFPPEFDWVLGGSYAGMPKTVAPVRNVWGGNSAVRRVVFDAIGGYRSEFGKVDDVSRPEDTDFCLRARQAFPSGHWLYEPAARVTHNVPSARTAPRYFLTRCWNEGRGKAALVRYVGAGDGTSSERQYATRVLPRAVMREIQSAFKLRDGAHLRRAAAIVAGLLSTAAGVVVETVHISWLAVRRRSAVSHLAPSS